MYRYLLVVDSSSLIRQVMIDSLEDFGYSVVGQAGDPTEALQQYQLLKPDVVIMNLIMVNNIAIDLIAQIKNSNPNTKIIICTSYEEQSLIMKALKAGATGFLSKPFDINEFQRLIQQIS